MATSMADYVPMVKGTASLGMAGPKLVKAGIGEDITTEELGGSAVHTKHGGADEECESDTVCISHIKEFLSYLPSNAEQLPPIVPTDDPTSRMCEELRDFVPTERRRAYDMRGVVRVLCDDGRFFEHRRAFAKNLITGFGRIGGRSVGFLANQPMHFAGTLDAAACTKATRFLWMCDAFGVPVVSSIDTPGFLVGSKAERENSVRHMGRMLLAIAHLSVPLVSIVVRKAYGGGYVAMAGGRSYHTEASWIWPTAEISAMGAEGSVDVAFHRDYESAEDPAVRRQEMIDEFYKQMTAVRAASGFGIDDAIDPAETRLRIAAVLRGQVARRRPNLPPKLHPIDPL